MSATNPPQLFLLADHIKLSLLERQRAISLNLSPNSQDSQISRSLEQLRAGIETLESQVQDVSDEYVLPPKSTLIPLSDPTDTPQINILPTPPPARPTRRPDQPIRTLLRPRLLANAHATKQPIPRRRLRSRPIQTPPRSFFKIKIRALPRRRRR